MDGNAKIELKSIDGSGGENRVRKNFSNFQRPAKRPGHVEKVNRLTVADRRQQVQPIYDLKCFKQVDEMIRAGDLIRKVARYIQTDKIDSEGRLLEGELLSLSEGALWHLVSEYRDHIFTGKDALDNPVADALDEDDPLYELNAMQRKFRQMESRIDMEVETEHGLTKLFSTTHKEFLTLSTLAENIMDRKEKLGLIDKGMSGVAGRKRIVSGLPGRVDVQSLLANPESRQKIIGVVEAMVSDPELFAEAMNQDVKKDFVHGKRGKRRVDAESRTLRRKKRKKIRNDAYTNGDD